MRGLIFAYFSLHIWEKKGLKGSELESQSDSLANFWNTNKEFDPRFNIEYMIKKNIENIIK